MYLICTIAVVVGGLELLLCGAGNLAGGFPPPKSRRQDCRRHPEAALRSSSMRKIIVGAQVALDGGMQAPGGPKEDPSNGFRFGGWAMPYFDEEAGEEIDRLFEPKFDLLLGRKTYEIFASYWPHYDEKGPPATSR